MYVHCQLNMSRYNTHRHSRPLKVRYKANADGLCAMTIAMDASSDHGSAANGSDLEVTGSEPLADIFQFLPHSISYAGLNCVFH